METNRIERRLVMKPHYVYIAYASAWVATSVAVCFAIYVIKSVYPLFALIIPLFISISTKPKGDNQ